VGAGRKFAVAVAALVAGCGGASEQPAGCVRPADSYLAHYVRLDHTGSCDSMSTSSTDSMKFDSHGQFVFPLWGAADCHTVQTGCELTVNCNGRFLNARLLFQGDLAADGSTLSGIAIMTGSYQGCDRVV